MSSETSLVRATKKAHYSKSGQVITSRFALSIKLTRLAVGLELMNAPDAAHRTPRFAAAGQACVSENGWVPRWPEKRSGH
jgi:hypothetical protein